MLRCISMQELLIADPKTELPGGGGATLRRVARDSVVLVRGRSDGDAAVVTWVALVTQVSGWVRRQRRDLWRAHAWAGILIHRPSLSQLAGRSCTELTHVCLWCRLAAAFVPVPRRCTAATATTPAS